MRRGVEDSDGDTVFVEPVKDRAEYGEYISTNADFIVGVRPSEAPWLQLEEYIVALTRDEVRELIAHLEDSLVDEDA